MPDGSQHEVTERIFDLLEQTTNLSVVSDFLRSKKLHHSAGKWEDMRANRLKRYLESGEISIDELIDLLRSVEECGSQHIFLFQAAPKYAQEIMDRDRVAAVLKARGLSRLLNRADVLVQPAEPQIVDVRWDTAGVDVAMTVKEVELRTRKKHLGDRQEGDRFISEYTYEKQRAVNLAKVHRNGLLELRIAAHSGSKYEEDINRFMVQLGELVPVGQFGEVSLDVAKQNLLAERKTDNGIVRYTNATICDGDGNFMQAITASETGDLGKAAGIGKGLDAVLEDEDAYCADSNLWFIKREELTRDTHVLLDGLVNEFVIPARCSVQNYNYVLSTIRRFNK